MIEKICNILTNKIRKEMPEIDDERAEVINYGLQLVIGEIPKFFIIFAFAYCLGVFKLTLLSFLFIMPYRMVSGGTHLHTHPYIIIEPMPQQIFRDGWNAQEELLLLHAIQVCGLGNWHEVENIVRTKNCVECETHYVETYLKCDTAPYPEYKGILPPVVLPPPPTYDTSPRDSRPSISHEKNLAERGKKDRTTPAEYAGWMPRRDEFEVEFQNEAEQLVANITFNDDEQQSKFDQDIKALLTYNEILEERYKRIQLAKEWDLLDEELRPFGGKSKAEKDIEESLLSLAQIINRDELTEFILLLEKEQQIRNDLDTLLEWRHNGIATREEGIMFNELKRLMSEEKLTLAQIDKWNKNSMMRAESAEFKSSQDRQLLSASENNLCYKIAISPMMYLVLKDLLVREFTIRSKMTEEIAVSFAPEHAETMKRVFEYLNSNGYFYLP